MMRDPYRVSLGQRLAFARGKASQATMAAELGVDRVTLSFYENGRSSVSAAILAVYVHKGWSAKWLITGEGRPRR
ncbi:Helix-turn-helix [Luteibacter sp. 22Crub2.1]|nr:Helix-turn-helix [Luteibacter sp. 22Crub2.1]